MLIVITGPSGVGKTTIIKALMEANPKLKYSVSLTTRQQRFNEKHGIDYYFISVDEFKEMIEKNELAEWSEVYGKYYGRSKKELDELARVADVLVGIDVQGALKLQKTYPNGVFVFLLPRSKEALETQLKGRGTDDESSIKIRLDTAIHEMEKSNSFNYSVVNDVIDHTVKDIQSIINTEKIKNSRDMN